MFWTRADALRSGLQATVTHRGGCGWEEGFQTLLKWTAFSCRVIHDSPWNASLALAWEGSLVSPITRPIAVVEMTLSLEVSKRDSSGEQEQRGKVG